MPEDSPHHFFISNLPIGWVYYRIETTSSTATPNLIAELKKHQQEQDQRSAKVITEGLIKELGWDKI